MTKRRAFGLALSVKRTRSRLGRFLDRHPFDFDQWLACAAYTLLVVFLVMFIAFLVRWGPTLKERLENDGAAKPCVVVLDGRQP